jgi:hypothetical protein
MPIGPIGQPPIKPDDPNGNNAANTPNKSSFQAPKAVTQPETPTPAKLAAQLVQSSRTAAASGTNSSLAPQLSQLVNALTSHMGMPELPKEQQQHLVAQLSEDPVVKTLIG